VIPALLRTPTKPLNQQDEKASRWVNCHTAPCITQTFGAACEIMPNICYQPPMLTASSRRLPDVIFLNPMIDAETIALVERARLSMTLVLFAASREIEAARSSDHRYAEAAASIKRITGTMDQVSDDVLLKLVTVNQLSEGLLSTLIAAAVVRGRRCTSALRGCQGVLRARRATGRCDPAQRAPASALKGSIAGRD
jgi:hypothetical protein